MKQKYYVIAHQILPTIKKEDLLVGHIYSKAFRHDYVKIYPKLEYIKQISVQQSNNTQIKKNVKLTTSDKHAKKLGLLQAVNTDKNVYLYEIKLIPQKHTDHVTLLHNKDMMPYHFHLSHYSERVREYEQIRVDTLEYKEDYQRLLIRLTKMKLLNGVNGNLYNTQQDAIQAYHERVAYLQTIAILQQQERYEKYLLLKQEFETT